MVTLPFEIEIPVTLRLLPLFPSVIPLVAPQTVSFAKSAMFPPGVVVVLNEVLVVPGMVFPGIVVPILVETVVLVVGGWTLRIGPALPTARAETLNEPRCTEAAKKAVTGDRRRISRSWSLPL